MAKNLPAMQETWIWFLGGEDTLEKGIGNPLQWKSHGQRSLAGYSLWSLKESDTIE